MMRISAGFVTILLFCACSGSGGDDGPRPMQAGGNGNENTTSGGGAGITSTAGTGAGAAGGAASGAGSSLEAPDQEQALVAFLNAKQYAGWAKEADYHKSTGPHGDAVRVFYSPKAALALAGNAATFPAGAAAVKELTSGGSLYGWSVWVKVQDATDGGNGFFWYELIHQGGGKESIYGNARGSGDCVGCHQAGKDYDLSTMPFQ
jgi:hypothetical protein